jgi:hypothetical protein
MVRDPLDPEDLADEIDHKKTDDHALDALRYALMSEGQPRQAPQPYEVHAGNGRKQPTPEQRLRALRGKGVDPWVKREA